VFHALHRKPVAARAWRGYSTTIPGSPTTQEHIMNISKNMEFIFSAIVLLATATNFATAGVPARAVSRAAAVAASDLHMQVVKVSAKRLTAAEKAALI